MNYIDAIEYLVWKCKRRNNLYEVRSTCSKIKKSKLHTMPNLKDIIVVTEESKAEWINWLGQTLDFLDTNDGNNYTTNRVFGTDHDDIEEARNILGAIFLTLQKNTLVPKLMLFILITIGLSSCNTQPVPVYQQQPVVVQQPVQQADPYQVYDNGSGGQVVYYTDPTSHASYWLEYALFMSMWNSPNRYYSINHYYVSHRSYIDSRSNYYRSSYTRRSSTTLNNNRPSSPSGGNRASSPSTRPSAPPSVRPSSPSSSASSTRSSNPGGGGYTPRPSSSSRNSSSRPSSPRRH